MIVRWKEAKQADGESSAAEVTRSARYQDAQNALTKLADCDTNSTPRACRHEKVVELTFSTDESQRNYGAILQQLPKCVAAGGPACDRERALWACTQEVRTVGGKLKRRSVRKCNSEFSALFKPRDSDPELSLLGDGAIGASALQGSGLAGTAGAGFAFKLSDTFRGYAKVSGMLGAVTKGDNLADFGSSIVAVTPEISLASLGLRGRIPQTWGQGRTEHGGLALSASAAVARLEWRRAEVPEGYEPVRGALPVVASKHERAQVTVISADLHAEYVLDFNFDRRQPFDGRIILRAGGTLRAAFDDANRSAYWFLHENRFEEAGDNVFAPERMLLVYGVTGELAVQLNGLQPYVTLSGLWSTQGFPGLTGFAVLAGVRFVSPPIRLNVGDDSTDRRKTAAQAL